MRTLPLFMMLFALGCDAKPNPESPTATPIAKSLGLSDPAPGLSVSQWLHGSPVTLAPGKVYVVEFWAVHIEACTVAMPAVGALAKEYAPKNVEFVAVASLDDQGNTLDAVERYVKKTGHQFAIHFAWCDKDATLEAWMVAANLSVVPMAFVIDRTGRIAFIGPPNDLDEVLPRVIAGTWRGRADVEAITAITARLHDIFDRVDRAGLLATQSLKPEVTAEERNQVYLNARKSVAAKALEDYAALLKEHPNKASNMHGLSHSMVLHLQLQQWDEARKQAEAILKECRITGDSATLLFVFQQWISKLLNPDRKHTDIAVAAAEIVLQYHGELDEGDVLAGAHANKLAGNTARCEALIAQARKLTAHDPARLAKVETAIAAFK